MATSALAQQPGPAVSGMEPLLTKIATYHYGQSREALAQISVFIEKSMGSPAALQQIEGRLLRFLQSDATADAKHAVFKELSRIATDASVPMLSGVLTRAETVEMARYALARIPTPAAGEALRKALETTAGKTKIGIINSLGERRDAQAVPALRGLIRSPDSQVAGAAIYALGHIASRAAFDALAAASRDANSPERQSFVDAYLLCAGILAAEGGRDDALKAYRQLDSEQESDMVRIAALTGLASLDAENSVRALQAAIDSKSPTVQAAAIRLLAGIPGRESIDALTRAFPKLAPPAQVRVLTALAQRGDVSGRPLLNQAAKASEPRVQVAGLSVLGKVGDENSVALLAESAAAGKGPVQTAARESLASLRGANIDAAIIKGIAASKGPLQSEFILAAGERRSPEAADVLTQTIRDPDPEVRRAALRALRKVAGPSQVTGLLEALKTTDADDREEAAQALAAALKKSQASDVNTVIAAYRSAGTVETRLALLGVLGQTSNAEALGVLRSALKEVNPEIVRGSILALTGWSDSAPMPDLLALAKNRGEPGLQILSLRGYLKLLALPSQRSHAESARLLGEAIQLAKEPAEKRSALAQLTAYPCEEALKIAETYLKDQTVAVEAKASVERIRNVLK
jgi:HEAT repeat protein